MPSLPTIYTIAHLESTAKALAVQQARQHPGRLGSERDAEDDENAEDNEVGQLPKVAREASQHSWLEAVPISMTNATAHMQCWGACSGSQPLLHVVLP